MRLQNDGDIQRVLSLYALPIYRLAYARTRSQSDAEDICQEVFLELVSRNPAFPTENARRAWLIRVTVNKSNSLWRTLWRRRVELRERVEVAAQSDEASALADALAALSEDDRMLIHLFYYEGLKSGEIARILKRRPDAVRKQLSRARARMKRILSGEGFE